MTKFEEQMLKAQEEDQIIFYDYLQYKKAAGWFTKSSCIDWNRPEVIKKAMYYANFLLNLPDYYFMGFPIKELLKSSYSSDKCNACVVALSLYFEDFQIVTCNLKNYVDYCNENSINKIEEYKHTFIIVGINNTRTIIDTTFGFITDMGTYNSIFAIDKVSIIFSEEITCTDVYKYIKDRKNKKGPSKESQLEQNEEYKNYIEEILKYESLCRTYMNQWNPCLEEFIHKSLLNNSNKDCFFQWRILLHVKPDNLKIEYPTKNMLSLEDDEYDLKLDNFSRNEQTIKRNKKVLEDYHKEPEEIKENKIKKLFNKLFN